MGTAPGDTQGGYAGDTEAVNDLPPPLRRHRPILAIALSGYGTEDDVRRSREAGFRDHLVTPVDMNQLLRAVERHAAEAPRDLRFSAGPDPFAFPPLPTDEASRSGCRDSRERGAGELRPGPAPR